MNLISIALKSIRQRLLASSLTALSVALGVMLMVTVLVIHGVVERTFSQNAFGYDLIVGRKGSQLDLVLSTVYRIGKPIGNLPYSYYKELRDNEPRVKEAIPFAYGDFTEEGGFPIVGTVSRYFRLDYAPGKSFQLKKGGKGLRKPFDALIGAEVARTNNWQEGSEFKLVHGGAESDHVHDEKFKVAGILAPTGTSNDKTVFVQLNGFYQIAGHEKPPAEAIKTLREFYGKPQLSEEEMAAEVKRLSAGHDHHNHESHDHSGHQHAHDVPDELKEVSAVLLQMRSEMDAPLFSGLLNKEFRVQAVNPIIPMSELKRNFIGPVRNALLILTVFIVIVSGVSIFVSIYNSMADRKREIAIMRALGAQRTTVFSIILTESVLLCLCGGVLGILLGHGLNFFAAMYLEMKSGLQLDPWAFEPAEMIVLPCMILLASLVGFIPGMTAYHTDVAETLSS